MYQPIVAMCSQLLLPCWASILSWIKINYFVQLSSKSHIKWRGFDVQPITLTAKYSFQTDSFTVPRPPQSTVSNVRCDIHLKRWNIVTYRCCFSQLWATGIIDGENRGLVRGFLESAVSGWDVSWHSGGKGGMLQMRPAKRGSSTVIRVMQLLV